MISTSSDKQTQSIVSITMKKERGYTFQHKIFDIWMIVFICVNKYEFDGPEKIYKR